MSIQLINAVFESQSLGPTDRLVMLALADHAGEDGTCYPSVARLCQRTGLGERAVQVAIGRLKSGGHLSAKIGGGRGNSTLYTLHINPAPETPYEKPRTRNPVSNDINPAYPALNPAPDAPEPSITIIEPKKKEREVNLSRASGEVDGCVAHFNAVADRVGWPQVQKITPARKSALIHRMADCGGVDAWCEAMDRAALSPLLTGQAGRGWRADFDWLCKAGNFTKLMEGNYDPRNSAQGQPRPGQGNSMAEVFMAVGAARSRRAGASGGGGEWPDGAVQ